MSGVSTRLSLALGQAPAVEELLGAELEARIEATRDRLEKAADSTHMLRLQGEVRALRKFGADLGCLAQE